MSTSVFRGDYLSNMSLSNKELWEQGKEMLEILGIHDECPQGDGLFQD